MALTSCIRSPRLKKLLVFLLGTCLGVVLYLLMLQADGIHLDTLKSFSMPESSPSAARHQRKAKEGNHTVQKEKKQALVSEGAYPKWWHDAWQRSAVSGQWSKFVGDKPMFPPCRQNPSKHQTFPFIEKQRYMKNNKNPCWYEEKKDTKVLNCVPYFYLAGVARAGTSDIAKRMRMHPQIFHGTEKEYHWWERYRFGDYDDDITGKNAGRKDEMSFKEYLDQVTGRGILDLHNELRRNDSSNRVFGDISPSYLWDPQNWDMLEGNHGCTEPRIIVAQHIRHVFPAAKILLSLRHPTPRLYSRFVSRISRTPELKGSTVEDFHKYVLQGVQAYKKCFRTWSVRHCAYNVSLYNESPVRLVEGMYPVFIADWLRVWPRKQLFIMRYEDYGGHERERLAEIFDFLRLSPLSPAQMDRVMNSQPISTGITGYKKLGPMMEKTEKVLNDFYKPFLMQLTELLEDERFLWRDRAL